MTLKNAQLFIILVLTLILVYIFHKNSQVIISTLENIQNQVIDEVIFNKSAEITDLVNTYTDNLDQILHNTSHIYDLVESNLHNSTVYEYLLDLKSLLFQSKEVLKEILTSTVGNESFVYGIDTIRRLGYPYEMHTVHTDDGYILRIFRIQGKNTNKIEPLKKVIYLQHGAFDSSDAWVANYEHSAPAFILANAGFDVWLGNMRGNKYSRNHMIYDANKDKEYWDFTWQENEEYDLPSILTYIHLQTKTKISFAGHSQGGTIMIAALAERLPEVEELVDKVFTFGPVIYMNNLDNQLLKTLAALPFPLLFEFLKTTEALEPNTLINPTYALICKFFEVACSELISVVSDADSSGTINTERIHKWIARYPGGTSALTLLHFRQMTLEKEQIFRKYDYGQEENLKRYGVLNPTELKLEEIDKHFYIFAGLKDRMSSIEDLRQAANKTKFAVLKELKQTGHLGFVLGSNMEHVHEIIEILERND